MREVSSSEQPMVAHATVHAANAPSLDKIEIYNRFTLAFNNSAAEQKYLSQRASKCLLRSKGIVAFIAVLITIYSIMVLHPLLFAIVAIL